MGMITPDCSLLWQGKAGPVAVVCCGWARAGSNFVWLSSCVLTAPRQSLQPPWPAWKELIKSLL